MKTHIIALVISIAVTAAGTALALECADYRDHLHRLGRLELEPRAEEIVLVGHHAIVPVASGLRIHDVSNPMDMVQVGAYDWESTGVRAMEAAAGHLYLVGTDYSDGYEYVLRVFDIGIPRIPEPTARIPLADFPRSLTVADGLLWVVFSDRISIFDLGDPAHPAHLLDYTEHCGHGLERIAVVDGRAYLSGADPRLAILDVSNPLQPIFLGGASESAGYMRDICVADGFAYVASGSGGIGVYDVSVPGSAALVREVSLTSHCYHVGLHDGHLYASTSGYAGSGLWVMGLDTPGHPEVVDFTELSTYPHDFDFLDDRAFVLTCRTYDPSYLESLDVTSPGAVPGAQRFRTGTSANNALAWREPYIYWAGSNNGQDYLRSALIPEPGNDATVVGQVLLSGWFRDMAFVGDLLYIATTTDFDGIHIVRAGPDGALSSVGSFAMTTRPLDIEVTDSYVFVATEGVSILDVTDPASPVLAGTFREDAAVTSVRVDGDRLFLGYGQTTHVGGIEIWSIGDPLQPVFLGEYVTGSPVHAIDVAGDFLYGSRGGDLVVFDVSTPEAPYLVSTLPDVGGRIEVEGGVAYAAFMYSLNLVDVRRPEAPVIMGNLMYGGLRIVVADELILMSDNRGVAVAPRQCPLDPVLDVEIDIRPGSGANSVNCKNRHGVIPVAILTTPDFDALDIDHATVRFGPGGAAETHEKRGIYKRHETDVDGDLDVDLLFHFRNGETGIECGDTSAELTGETYDGRPIRGSGPIRTVPRGDGGDPDIDPDLDIAKAAPAGGFRFSAGCSPNPFNPSTRIWYELEVSSPVMLAIHDMAGRRVRTLRRGVVEAAGRHEALWDGCGDTGVGLPSGAYVFRLQAGDHVRTGRLMLIK